jgi:oligoribonuclease
VKHLVLDVETTGLDPASGQLLEVGAVLVTEDLQEIARFHAIVRQRVDWSEVADVVVAMHERNGLRALIDAGEGLPCRDVEAQLIRWLEVHAPTPTLVCLAGNSVHFDRGWLAQDMRRVYERLHYRQTDIGGLARELKACGVPVPGAPRMPHRGLDDALIELADWRVLRELVRGLAGLQAACVSASEAQYTSATPGQFAPVRPFGAAL